LLVDFSQRQLAVDAILERQHRVLLVHLEDELLVGQRLDRHFHGGRRGEGRRGEGAGIGSGRISGGSRKGGKGGKGEVIGLESGAAAGRQASTKGKRR